MAAHHHWLRITIFSFAPMKSHNSVCSVRVGGWRFGQTVPKNFKRTTAAAFPHRITGTGHPCPFPRDWSPPDTTWNDLVPWEGLASSPRLSDRTRWHSSQVKDIKVLEQVQRSATELWTALEHKSCGDGLREPSLFSLVERRCLGEDIYHFFHYLLSSRQGLFWEGTW